MAGITVHTESPINPNTAPKSQEPTAGPTTTATAPYVAASTTAYAANSAQTAQPGAVPAPTNTHAPSPTRPAPPQPGQVPQPFVERGRMPAPIQTQAQVNHSLPSPRMWTAYDAQPTRDLSHPPGYIQNHQASFEDRDLDGGNKTHTPSPTRGRGILDGAPLLRDADEGDASPIWDTAVSWAKEAGRKLSVVEGEVWKKINGEK